MYEKTDKVVNFLPNGFRGSILQPVLLVTYVVMTGSEILIISNGLLSLVLRSQIITVPSQLDDN